ncbi:hypothetical protein [Xanthomonas translucens]|uniref:hypothetical protein n=1 Tax=Xanthomonas campestris pv. translucens TaxID=343 RepID=UPI001E2A3611|nr:hypothetical protein [Xanthomonas translucens]
MRRSCSPTLRSSGHTSQRTAHAGAQRPSTCKLANTSVLRGPTGVKCRLIRTRPLRA